MSIIEKYSPKVLEDIVYPSTQSQQEIQYYKLSRVYTNPGNILLFGPYGTAKSTIARILAHDILDENYEFNTMELKGTSFTTAGQLRNKISGMCERVPVGSQYKVVIIDELDTMSSIAQCELRSLMDQFINDCVFMLTANVIENVDAGVMSRSRCVRIGRANPDAWLDRFKMILNREKVFNVSDGDIMKILNGSNGDIREILRNIQMLVTYNKSQNVRAP